MSSSGYSYYTRYHINSYWQERDGKDEQRYRFSIEYDKNGYRIGEYCFEISHDCPVEYGRQVVTIRSPADLNRLNDKGQTIEVYETCGRTVDARGGNDVLIVMNPFLAVKAKMGDGSDVAVGGFRDDKFWGGRGNDGLAGNDGDDTLYGEGGEDTLFGGCGDDKLYGGSGDDFLYGDAGDDTLVGGTGNDYMKGGAGCDVFQFSRDDYARCRTVDVIRDFCWDDKIRFCGISESHVRIKQDGDFARINIDFDGRGTDMSIRVYGISARDLASRNFIIYD